MQDVEKHQVGKLKGQRRKIIGIQKQKGYLSGAQTETKSKSAGREPEGQIQLISLSPFPQLLLVPHWSKPTGSLRVGKPGDAVSWGQKALAQRSSGGKSQLPSTEEYRQD